MVGRPELGWQGLGSGLSVEHHLTLSPSHPSCCTSAPLSKKGPCPCNTILPMAALAHCGNLSDH